MLGTKGPEAFLPLALGSKRSSPHYFHIPRDPELGRESGRSSYGNWLCPEYLGQEETGKRWCEESKKFGERKLEEVARQLLSHEMGSNEESQLAKRDVTGTSPAARVGNSCPLSVCGTWRKRVSSHVQCETWSAQMSAWNMGSGRAGLCEKPLPVSRLFCKTQQTAWVPGPGVIPAYLRSSEMQDS